MWTVFSCFFFVLPVVFMYVDGRIASISFLSVGIRKSKGELCDDWIIFIQTTALPIDRTRNHIRLNVICKQITIFDNEINNVRFACCEACASEYVCVCASVLWFVVQEFCKRRATANRCNRWMLNVCLLIRISVSNGKIIYQLVLFAFVWRDRLKCKYITE